MTFTLTVNGQQHAVDAAAGTPLLYIVRNDLQLNGPKFGCGLSQCGGCTVHLGDAAIRSCVTPVSNVGDEPITTLEGLGRPDALHPLQQAFIDEQAAECAYCTNGMIMSAAALLKQNPRPSDDDVKQALQGNLCRCEKSWAHPAGRPARGGVTGMMATRRAFLVQSGAIVIGFTLLGGKAGRALAETSGHVAIHADEADQAMRLDQTTTGATQLDSWLSIDRNGDVTIFSGKV
jgi:nicotinate dehydrogenase subunit A